MHGEFLEHSGNSIQKLLFKYVNLILSTQMKLRELLRKVISCDLVNLRVGFAILC